MNPHEARTERLTPLPHTQIFESAEIKFRRDRRAEIAASTGIWLLNVVLLSLALAGLAVDVAAIRWLTVLL